MDRLQSVNYRKSASNLFKIKTKEFKIALLRHYKAQVLEI